ncbi:MAG: DUF3568 family protein [Candidatus Omnitrophica bacterium]|nr:DUF3568 family protein [Candidatus Omnitrophota bacterium]
MKSPKFFCLLLALSLLNLCGCIPLVVGGAGVLGGYAIGRDNITGNSDKPYNAIWRSALKAAKIKGKPTRENKEKGEIELEAEKSLVCIKLTKLTETATEIKVSARRYSLPNLKLAEEVFIKIIEEIK